MSTGKDNRRGFIAGSLAGIVALVPAAALLVRERHTGAPAETWLRGLNGKHRQFFDVGSIQGGIPLRRVHNFLATYAAAYGIKESDVNAVFGAHGPGLPFTLSDSVWAKYELGAMYNVTDPATGKPAVRNMFVEMQSKIGNVPPEASISRLQARGVRFLACNNTLNSLSEQLAARQQSDVGVVRQELLSAVLSGVTVVPAMAIAVNRAQESGLTYAALG
jgi:intracellular sulfur oxidation DsrE/DsrF family protein